MTRRWLFVVALAGAFPSFPDSEFAPSASTQSVGVGAAAVAKTALLDLNTASKEDLVALSGIGFSYAQKIIDGRPYARKEELVTRNIVSLASYGKIKDQVRVQHPTK